MTYLSAAVRIKHQSQVRLRHVQGAKVICIAAYLDDLCKLLAVFSEQQLLQSTAEGVI